MPSPERDQPLKPVLLTIDASAQSFAVDFEPCGQATFTITRPGGREARLFFSCLALLPSDGRPRRIAELLASLDLSPADAPMLTRLFTSHLRDQKRHRLFAMASFEGFPDSKSGTRRCAEHRVRMGLVQKGFDQSAPTFRLNIPLPVRPGVLPMAPSPPALRTMALEAPPVASLPVIPGRLGNTRVLGPLAVATDNVADSFTPVLDFLTPGCLAASDLPHLSPLVGEVLVDLNARAVAALAAGTGGGLWALADEFSIVTAPYSCCYHADVDSAVHYLRGEGHRLDSFVLLASESHAAMVQALDEYRAALASQPRSLRARRGLAITLEALGELKDAHDLLTAGECHLGWWANCYGRTYCQHETLRYRRHHLHVLFSLHQPPQRQAVDSLRRMTAHFSRLLPRPLSAFWAIDLFKTYMFIAEFYLHLGAAEAGLRSFSLAWSLRGPLLLAPGYRLHPGDLAALQWSVVLIERHANALLSERHRLTLDRLRRMLRSIASSLRPEDQAALTSVLAPLN